MILVVTLLSVLFVVGVAFMATMNFESQMIDVERQATDTAAGIAAVDRATDDLLGNAFVGDTAGPTPPNASVSAAPPLASAVGTQNLERFAAPIEPHYLLDPVTNDRLAMIYGGFTDTELLMTGKHANPNANTNGPELCTTPEDANCFITPSGYSPDNRPAISGSPEDPRVTYDKFPGDYVSAVDVDGDGLRDSYQVNIKYLGFSKQQQRALSAAVNTPGQLREDVFLGLRIIPHGGMVNVNDAHPLLIQNVFDLTKWPSYGDAPDAEDDFFVHAPTQDNLYYTPAMDEPALRRRGFLPPKMLHGATATPSRLTGNPFVSAGATASDIIATSDMQRLFWPKPRNGTDEERLRNWPIRWDEEWDDNILLFNLRMNADDAKQVNQLEYDRRHLVTTTSHDDLLAPKMKVCTSPYPACFDADATNDQVVDMVDRMNELNGNAIGAVQNADPRYYNASCRLDPQLTFTLPFEYAAYPQSIVDTFNKQTCTCQGDPNCKTDPVRKGRLKLSLSWLDQAWTNNVINTEQRNNLIYDAFAMLISGVVGAYWDEPQCGYDPNTPGGPRLLVNGSLSSNARDVCPDGSVCRFWGDASIAGGSLNGRCTTTPAAWDTPLTCMNNSDCGPGPYRCVADPASGTNVCADAQMAGVAPAQSPAQAQGNLNIVPLYDFATGSGQPVRRQAALISRTAAALTANLIDYADADNLPTRIQLRLFDFSSPYAGMPLYDTHNRPLYVYGVERQPYLSELVTFIDPNQVQDPNALPSDYAVEIFNPFDEPLPRTGDPHYWLLIAPQGTQQLVNPINNTLNLNVRKLELTQQLNPLALPGKSPNGMTVVYSGTLTNLLVKPDGTGSSQLPDGATTIDATGKLSFASGETIYLAQRVQNSNNPNDVDWIILDQMNVGNDSTGIGLSQDDLLSRGQVYDSGLPILYSFERVLRFGSLGATALDEVYYKHWTVTVPDEDENQQGYQSLGTESLRTNPTLQPVEVYPPNLQTGPSGNGQFATYNRASGTLTQAAFQSTGEMLLILRHANHSARDYDLNYQPGLSFTQRLMDQYRWQYVKKTIDPNTGQEIYTPTQVVVKETDQIDNGRMPVFDVGSKNAGTMEFAHHLSPTRTLVDQPGGLSTLPWGQRVFDYFTSLPLSNPGPYRVTDEVAKSRWQAARPRVDMNGLRVHGRIDLNAAPWYVMKGLPFVPMNTLPDAQQNHLRQRVADALVLDATDNKVHWIGEPLAQSIAAYRDGRAIVDHATNSTTGNYGNGDPANNIPGWRGWGLSPPEARRGTGFLTVGELANVRHTSAFLNGGNSAFYRSDSGVISNTKSNVYDGDYVQAIAVLVALSDWVTVRSHVFTVYGTVRGSPQAVDSDPATAMGALSNDPDTLQQQLEDVDSRALRFQETLDRLPLLLGQPEPTRIGGRALTSYSDFTTD